MQTTDSPTPAPGNFPTPGSNPGVPTQTQRAPAAAQLSREQILEVTLGCLREQGYDDTTIRRIAGRLRCAVGSIYRYFVDKRELLLATTQQILEPVLQGLEQGGSFEQSVQRYARIARDDVEPYRLMFWLASVPQSDKAIGSPASAESPTSMLPHLLPPIVLDIVDQWAERLGDRDRALRTWGVLHGLLVADLSTDTIFDLIASMNVAADGAAHEARPAMAQLVTLLTKPTPKGPPRPQPIVQDEAEIENQDETSEQHAALPRRGADDVTLL